LENARDRGGQFAPELVLGQKTVGARGAALFGERGTGVVGDDDDADVGEVPAQQAGQHEAVHLRHVQVRQDQVGLQGAGQQMSLMAVARGADDVERTVTLQQHADGDAHQWIVVHDQRANPPAAGDGAGGCNGNPCVHGCCGR